MSPKPDIIRGQTDGRPENPTDNGFHANRHPEEKDTPLAQEYPSERISNGKEKEKPSDHIKSNSETPPDLGGPGQPTHASPYDAPEEMERMEWLVRRGRELRGRRNGERPTDGSDGFAEPGKHLPRNNDTETVKTPLDSGPPAPGPIKNPIRIPTLENNLSPASQEVHDEAQQKIFGTFSEEPVAPTSPVAPGTAPFSQRETSTSIPAFIGKIVHRICRPWRDNIGKPQR